MLLNGEKKQSGSVKMMRVADLVMHRILLKVSILRLIYRR